MLTSLTVASSRLTRRSCEALRGRRRSGEPGRQRAGIPPYKLRCVLRTISLRLRGQVRNGAERVVLRSNERPEPRKVGPGKACLEHEPARSREAHPLRRARESSLDTSRTAVARRRRVNSPETSNPSSPPSRTSSRTQAGASCCAACDRRDAIAGLSDDGVSAVLEQLTGDLPEGGRSSSTIETRVDRRRIVARRERRRNTSAERAVCHRTPHPSPPCRASS